MMKRYFVLVFIAVILFLTSVNGQTDTIVPNNEVNKIKHYNIGIFAPLYLDSLFSSTGNFKPKQGMPKFVIPAVDFVNGAQVALDSMKLDSENIDAYIYDTKSYTQPLAALLKSSATPAFDLLIGAVRDIDYRLLADYAASKQIPFISAVYPNDGGITQNPYTVIVNSTLKAHCEAIYSYILQSHGTDKIYLLRRKGTQEDKVASYFKSFNEQDGKSLLKIETINIDSNLRAETLKPKLDSNINSVIIGGSLDESFAYNLAHACDDLHSQYSITLIGMPNWDGFKKLQKRDEFEDFPIYYTTPFYSSKADYYNRLVVDAFANRTKGKPTDMAYRGFEATYYFTKLLTKHPNNIMGNLNDKLLKLFTEYNFKPVSVGFGTTIPDYFENKHLYLVKMVNGNIVKAW